MGPEVRERRLFALQMALIEFKSRSFKIEFLKIMHTVGSEPVFLEGLIYEIQGPITHLGGA